MRARHVVVVACLGVVLFAAAASFAQDGVLLRAKYEAGQKYLAVIGADQDLVQHLAGGDNPVKQYMQFEIALEVMEVAPDGAASIRATYRRIAFKTDSAMFNLDYDSADEVKSKSDHPALVGFKALVGRSLTMKVSDRGKVVGVSGMKALVEAVLAETPAGPAREAARKQLAPLMDETRFAKQMSFLGLTLPEESVSKGSTWKSEDVIDLGAMNLKLQNSYTVKEIAGDVATVTVASKLTPGDGRDADAPMKIDVLSGSQTGEIKLSTVNALLNNGRLHQDLRMRVTAGGQSAEISLKSTNTVRVTPE